jgi:hypothetical protein
MKIFQNKNAEVVSIFEESNEWNQVCIQSIDKINNKIYLAQKVELISNKKEF